MGLVSSGLFVSPLIGWSTFGVMLALAVWVTCRISAWAVLHTGKSKVADGKRVSVTVGVSVGGWVAVAVAGGVSVQAGGSVGKTTRVAVGPGTLVGGGVTIGSTTVA